MGGPRCRLECADASSFAKTIPSGSVQCIICDPPFGIGEGDFDRHYARDAHNVADGYVSAPQDPRAYRIWAQEWISELPRILNPDGTVYIVCAWNHVCDIELVVRETSLVVLNHIIWKFNFGVHTKKKFVTSHYHILRCGLATRCPTFYNCAFFDETDKTESGGSAQYADLEDVWVIKKEYHPGKEKNINKLPDHLVEKMIRYATNPGDVVCDLFMGNFTTARVAIQLGRNIVGCDINRGVCDLFIPQITALLTMPADRAPERLAAKASTKPPKSGTRISPSERARIIARYDELIVSMTQKECLVIMQAEFERGHFGLLNIIKSKKDAPSTIPTTVADADEPQE